MGTTRGTTASEALSTDHWRQVFREFVRYTPSGDTIPDETWRRRHRNVILLALAHVPALLLLASFEGTESLVTGARIPTVPLWQVGLELGVIVALALAATTPRLPRRARTMLAVASLLFCSGVLVHFSGGYIEAHFHFFVATAVIAVYEDWVPFAFGIGYVVLTHGVFGMVEPSRVYNHPAAIEHPWVWGVIHGVFVAGLALALMANWYSTEKSREAAAENLEQARERAQAVEDLQAEREAIEEEKAEAERLKAEAEAEREAVERRNERLEATADEFARAMREAADGDLTVRLDPAGDSEAMGRIAEAFNDMMDDTESAVAEIQAFAREVSETGAAVEGGVQEAEAASEEVSDAIGEIAADATDQRELLTTVADEMGDLSATVEEVAASADAVAETSHETAEIAADGEETARDAIADAREVQAAIDATVERVEALDEQMAAIDDIVDLIGDVAEQTNILALNANIEAANAGDGADGAGFAVVADEVKQLAEETQASAAEIGDLIEETQTRTAETVAEVREASDHMDAGVAAVEDVLDAFERVAENAAEADEGIRSISEATDEQAASTEEVVSIVDEAVEISERTAEQTDSVSAAAQQQAASMAQVSGTVGSLGEQADRLTTLLAGFDASGGRTGSGGTRS